MMHWGNYGWGMGFGWIWMILVWVLVILGIVYVIKLIVEKRGSRGKEESALDILKKRYARGEISKEEFEKMKNDLK